MKSLLSVLACLVVLLTAHAAADPLIQPNDRLAFCGDGMTADLGYTVYVEDYLIASAQVPGLTTAEFGWLGGSPGDLLLQLDAHVAPFKPTVAINGPVTNHGMATVKMPSDQVLKLYNIELARPPK